MHEPKKAGFLPFFHIGQSCRNPVSPSVQPKGLTASLFLRLSFGFSSGWHSFPILVVERVAARINQVVECPAAVMVAKTVVDGFVSDKSVFVCRHDGICLKGFVLLLVFVSQKYTTICAIYLRRCRKMHFFHHFRSFIWSGCIGNSPCDCCAIFFFEVFCSERRQEPQWLDLRWSSTEHTLNDQRMAGFKTLPSFDVFAACRLEGCRRLAPIQTVGDAVGQTDVGHLHPVAPQGIGNGDEYL